MNMNERAYVHFVAGLNTVVVDSATPIHSKSSITSNCSLARNIPNVIFSFRTQTIRPMKLWPSRFPKNIQRTKFREITFSSSFLLSFTNTLSFLIPWKSISPMKLHNNKNWNSRIYQLVFLFNLNLAVNYWNFKKYSRQLNFHNYWPLSQFNFAIIDHCSFSNA